MADAEYNINTVFVPRKIATTATLIPLMDALCDRLGIKVESMTVDAELNSIFTIREQRSTRLLKHIEERRMYLSSGIWIEYIIAAPERAFI